MSGEKFGTGSVKIGFYNHYANRPEWADRLVIEGLPYSAHGISVTTNNVENETSLSRNLSNVRPEIDDGDGGFDLGTNTGDNPKFTITLKDKDGIEVTTGIFTAELLR